MATFDDVRRLALALPETSETTSRGQQHWKVKDKLFVWERPLLRPDLAELGDAAPAGPILGVRVDGIDAKEALLASEPELFFTITHFDGYPAVLTRLKKISVKRLHDLVLDAWLARAPAAVIKAFRAREK